MKTRKTAFLVLFALVMSGALVIFGCDDPAPPPSKITFTVKANTPSGENTNRLEISFSEEVAELKANDITITSDVATRGSLSGGPQNYMLSITVADVFAGTYPCSVSINKTGIDSSPQAVTIINNKGKADFRVDTTEVKEAKATLTIKLTKAVDLTANNITLSDGTGKAVKGNLTGSGMEYTLPVTGVVVGTISVKIEHDEVNPSSKSLTLSDTPSTTDPDPGTGGGPTKPADQVRIDPYPGYPYSSVISNDFDVENGYPRRYKASITPTTARQDVLWETLDSSIATVDKDGIVTPKKTGKTVLTAKATDGSGIGTYKEITVIDRKYPKSVWLISMGGNTAAGGYNNDTRTIGNNSTITLYIGDKALWFTAALKIDDDLTNDQSLADVLPMPLKFTLASTYETDHPKSYDQRKQFSLTAGLESTSERIRFKSDYSPYFTYADFNVSIALLPITTPKITYYKDVVTDNTYGVNMITGTTSGMTFDVTAGKPIYVAIESLVPYSNITMKGSSTLDSSSSNTIMNGKVRQFQVKIHDINLGDFSGSISLASLEYSIAYPSGVTSSDFKGNISFYRGN